MKELLKELGFEQLPMLSEFVTETYTYRSAQARLTQIVEYKEFITQHLTKGMFIPCSEGGEVLTEPTFGLNNFEATHTNSTMYHIDRVKYQQAKERVIFEGEQYTWEVLGLYSPPFTTIEQAINNGVKLILK